MLFGLFGKLTANPGERDALAEKLLRAADLMKAVPGCLLYVVNTSDTEPDSVWVTEIWRDENAHASVDSLGFLFASLLFRGRGRGRAGEKERETRLRQIRPSGGQNEDLTVPAVHNKRVMRCRVNRESP